MALLSGKVFSLVRSLVSFHHSTPRRYPIGSTYSLSQMDHANFTTSESGSKSDDNTETHDLTNSLPILSQYGHKHFQSSPRLDSAFLNPTKSSRKIYRIAVEGNIGSGKTTFLQIFSRCCTSTHMASPLIIPEPIELWRDVSGVNLFQLLADDPARWSFAFQSYVQLTMLKIHQLDPTEQQANFKAMERSLFSARYCFVENLYTRGLLKVCLF